jgi:peptidoglycan/LPS O-acetylase OafA/YrhL
MPTDRHPEQSVRAAVGRLDGIEALRAVAVLWVVAFHYVVVHPGEGVDPVLAWIAASPAANLVARSGYLGVDLFFLITGFLLVIPWARSRLEAGPEPRVADFYARRIRRIVPAYYVQLGFLFLVVAPLLLGGAALREQAGLVAVNAVAHAFFLHYTTPVTSASLSLNGALWTLTLEMEFYLLLPLLAPRFVRAPLAWSAALTGVAALWRWLALNDLAALVDLEMALGQRWLVPEAAIRHLLQTQLPGYLAHFAAGMGIAMWWLPRRSRPVGDAASAAWLGVLAAAAAAMYWAYGLGGGALLGPAASWLLTIACLAALMAATLRGGRLVDALLVHRPTLFVGRTSYSVYLYHLPLLYLWIRYSPLDGGALSFPAYLALVLAAGWLSYEYVERRFPRAPRAGPAAHPIIAG